VLDVDFSAKQQQGVGGDQGTVSYIDPRGTHLNIELGDFSIAVLNHIVVLKWF